MKTVFSVVIFLVLVTASHLYSQNASPLVIGETFTFPSKIMNETRRMNVYFPANYSESPETRFPVLYMPDGGMGEDFLHIAGLLQVSVGNGTMRPFILVGIENTQRRRDMTGPTENEEDKKIAPKVGRSKLFRDFIRQELMPLVKSRYRTTKETAIVGESLAGLFVMETLFLEPDMFDTYIAFDPSVWWNNEKLLQDAPKYLKALKTQKTLYVANSNEKTIVELVNRFEKVLADNASPNLKWYFIRMTDEKHSTIYHPAALQAFRKVFQAASSQ